MMLKNYWYVACRPEDVVDRPFARIILEQPMVFFRDAQGQVTAVEDFCPHRGAPLSLGFVDNGELVCGYHGLRLAADGSVASMPKQRVHSFPCNRRFPILERFGFVWVWPGDSDAADPDALPAFEWATQPGWTYGGGLYHVRADYRLMIDNLMDLTHETYVHASSIGQPEIDEQPVRTKVIDDTVVTSRFMDNVQAPPFWRMAMQQRGLDPDARVDRWQVCRFHAPSHVMIDVGVALVGHGGPEAPSAVKTQAVVVDFMTPETATSHWYFWGMARTWAVDDASVTETVRDGQGAIFAEDLAILEAQQCSLDRHPARKLLMLDIDAGGVQSRRMIQKLWDAEQQGDTESVHV